MQQQFTVTGMTCGHCEKAVTAAVRQLDPGAEVRIDRPSGKVDVVGSNSAELGLMLSETPVPEVHPRASRKKRYRGKRRMSVFMGSPRHF